MRARNGHVTRGMFLPLTLALGFGFGLTGCKQVNDMMGKGEEEESSEEEEPKEEKEAEPEVVELPPETPVEEAVAAELPPAVVEPPPEMAAPPLTGLDALLALVPKEPIGGKDSKVGALMIARDPGVLLEYAREGSRFVEAPMKMLAEGAAGQEGALADMAEMQTQYGLVKAQMDAAFKAVEEAGVKLDQGAMIMEVKGDDYVIVATDNPDGLNPLVKAIDPDADDIHCKAIEGHDAYVVCADTQAALDRYAPGGADEVAAVREQLATSLPGTDLEKTNLLAYVEGAWMSAATPPGLGVITIALPPDDETSTMFASSYKPGPAKLARAVQPGAGFIWASVEPALVALGAAAAGGEAMPKEVSDLVSQFSGEVLISGHYEPSAVSIQLGMKDTSGFAAMMDGAEALKPAVEEGIKGAELPGKVTYEVVEVPMGEAKTKAIHVGLSDLPEADVLASFTGLTMDAWAFATEDSFTLAVGASAEAIGQTAVHETEGPSDKLKAYLPPQLTTALDAGQVSMIVHMPMDALHGPETQKLVDAALKNTPDFSPKLVHGFLGMLAPISSGTMWTTHAGGGVQIHMAVQGIGHNADEEGKAALDAAVAVAGGADPAATFGPLVTEYAASPRLASYRVRSGEAKDALIASGVGGVVVATALAVPMVAGTRNEALAEELAIEEGAAEEAVEDSKIDPSTPIKDLDPEKKPKPKPKPKKKDDKKPSTKDDDKKPADDGKKDDKDDTAPVAPKPPSPTPPSPTPPSPTPPADGGGDDGGDKPTPKLPKKPKKPGLKQK